jgi:hypothetical protein
MDSNWELKILRIYQSEHWPLELSIQKKGGKSFPSIEQISGNQIGWSMQKSSSKNVHQIRLHRSNNQKNWIRKYVKCENSFIRTVLDIFSISARWSLQWKQIINLKSIIKVAVNISLTSLCKPFGINAIMGLYGVECMD